MSVERMSCIKRVRGRSSARASSEFLQIVILRRQNDGRRGNLILAVADKGRLIALHRPIEIVKVSVLAEAGGVDPSGFRVRIGADDLRLLATLSADRARLLLTRRAHALVGGLERRSIGEVGALDANIEDLHTVLPGNLVQRGTHAVHDSLALRCQKRGKFYPPKFISDLGAENRPQLLGQLLLGAG